MNVSITAINKKYQTAVNKAYKLYRDYHDLVNSEESETKQAKKFENYLNIFEELPVREQKNFEKQHTKIHGYS